MCQEAKVACNFHPNPKIKGLLESSIPATLIVWNEKYGNKLLSSLKAVSC